MNPDLKSAEVICAQCGQVNSRPRKALPFLYSSSDYRCPACGTPFDGGPREPLWLIYAAKTYFYTYGANGLVYGTVFGFAAMIAAKLAASASDIESFGWAGFAIGFAFGLYRADRARRRGELLHRHENKPPTKPPHPDGGR